MTHSPAPNSPAMRVQILPVTAYQQNCSLIWCTATMRGAFCDPGGDLDRLKAAALHHNVTIEKIIVTHGHMDHCGLAGELAKHYSVPLEGPHKEDKFWIDQMASGMMAGVPCAVFTPDRWLEDGDEVRIGNLSLHVFHCPGHTPGHVVFFHAESKLALVGDVLFKGSIGRTDFPRGHHQSLIESITRKLWPLGNDITFVPGHGATSTFGQERQSNPFVGDKVLT
jgi:hydroxyacylglutathione hydrolase